MTGSFITCFDSPKRHFLKLQTRLSTTIGVFYSNKTGAYNFNDQCGTRPLYQSGPQPRVFNGRNAPPAAWPWVGQIFHPQRDCIAVLISENLAVTRGFCATYVA